MLSSCSAANRVVSQPPTSPSGAPPLSVEQVLACGPKGLAQLYRQNAFSSDEWTTADQAATGLGKSLFGARSPIVRPWASVSSLKTSWVSVAESTWLVSDESGAPLGVVGVVPTRRGANQYFAGNVTVRCFQ